MILPVDWTITQDDLAAPGNRLRVDDLAALGRNPDRRHARRARRAAGPVQTTTVDPRVWATARELADGDMRRVRVLGPACVVVFNFAATSTDYPAPTDPAGE
jgi:hypothetical protein